MSCLLGRIDIGDDSQAFDAEVGEAWNEARNLLVINLSTNDQSSIHYCQYIARIAGFGQRAIQ